MDDCELERDGGDPVDDDSSEPSESPDDDPPEPSESPDDDDDGSSGPLPNRPRGPRLRGESSIADRRIPR